MSTVNLSGVVIISMIAVAAPIIAASLRRVRVLSAVVEIVAGILVGRSVLGWMTIIQPLTVLSLLGLALLLLLARLEIDLMKMTRSELRAPTAGSAGSHVLGAVAGVAFHAVAWVPSQIPSSGSRHPLPRHCAVEGARGEP